MCNSLGSGHKLTDPLFSSPIHQNIPHQYYVTAIQKLVTFIPSQHHQKPESPIMPVIYKGRRTAGT